MVVFCGNSRLIVEYIGCKRCLYFEPRIPLICWDILLSSYIRLECRLDLDMFFHLMLVLSLSAELSFVMLFVWAVASSEEWAEYKVE